MEALAKKASKEGNWRIHGNQRRSCSMRLLWFDPGGILSPAKTSPRLEESSDGSQMADKAQFHEAATEPWAQGSAEAGTGGWLPKRAAAVCKEGSGEV